MCDIPASSHLNVLRARTLLLKLQVREKSSIGKMVIDEIAEFIESSYPNKESGIVYCFSRKECEQVCIILIASNVLVHLLKSSEAF